MMLKGAASAVASHCAISIPERDERNRHRTVGCGGVAGIADNGLPVTAAAPEAT
jgi:hypothetical protein